jgi:hypothetical protein
MHCLQGVRLQRSDWGYSLSCRRCIIGFSHLHMQQRILQRWIDLQPMLLLKPLCRYKNCVLRRYRQLADVPMQSWILRRWIESCDVYCLQADLQCSGDERRSGLRRWQHKGHIHLRVQQRILRRWIDLQPMLLLKPLCRYKNCVLRRYRQLADVPMQSWILRRWIESCDVYCLQVLQCSGDERRSGLRLWQHKRHRHLRVQQRILWQWVDLLCLQGLQHERNDWGHFLCCRRCIIRLSHLHMH